MWGNNYNGYNQQPAWAAEQPRRSMYGYGQPAQSNMQWVRVNGAQGAREVSVQPGGEVWIMDESRPVFYFKQANAMGQTVTKAFRFEEIGLDDSAAGMDVSRFATKEDLVAINQRLERLDKFANEMGGINA